MVSKTQTLPNLEHITFPFEKLLTNVMSILKLVIVVIEAIIYGNKEIKFTASSSTNE